MRLKLAAGAVCTAVLGANAWTIARETAAPSWDDAWYLETSFRLFDALKDGPLAFAAAYADALKIKAPLVALLPLPLYAAWGPSERLAVWVNQGLLVALWTCVYGFARRLYGERAALCALIVAAVMPLTYGLSRLFLVETLLAALVAWTHYLIASATAEDSTAGRRLGAALGLGLLAKSIFPLYVAAAVWQRRRALAPHAKTALYWGGIIAGTWYAFNLPYVVGFGLSAGFGSIGRDYSSTLGEYATSVGGHALSWPLTAASAALLLALPRAQRRSWHWEPAERLWIGWAGVPAAVLLLGVNKDIRFLGPALPGLAVGLGRAAAQLLDSRGPLLPLVLLALPLGVLSCQTFGFPEGKALFYNGPAGRVARWDREAVIDLAARQSPSDAVVAVALEDMRMNANNLTSLAAERGLSLRFVNLGYAQAGVEGALIRLKDKNASRVLLFEGVHTDELPVFLNRANTALAERLRSGALRSRKLGETPVAPGVRAELWGLAP